MKVISMSSDKSIGFYGPISMVSRSTHVLLHV